MVCTTDRAASSTPKAVDTLDSGMTVGVQVRNKKHTDHFVLNSPSLKIEDLPRQARDKHTRERDPRSKSKRPFGVPGEGVSVYGGKFGYDRWVGTFENDLPHGVGLMYMAAATDGDGEGGGCDSEDSRPFEFIRGEPVEER